MAAISGPDRTSPAMPNPLADGVGAATEHAVGALADVLRGDARQLGAAERQREHEFAVGALARPHAEVDEVLPIERGEQVGGRRRLVGENAIHRALGVEVRHLVLALQRRQPRIVERHPLARVLERRPDDVLDAGLSALPEPWPSPGRPPVRPRSVPRSW